MQKNNCSKQKNQKSSTDNKSLKLAVLYNGQSIFFEEKILDVLLEHKIYAKLAGVSNSTKNNQAFLDMPYYLDVYSTTFIRKEKLIYLQYLTPIAQKQLLQVQKNIPYRVFSDLRSKFYLIDGHKFGGNFLAYEEDPSSNHAKYLVFCYEKPIQQFVHKDFNQMTRLAELCKKSCLLCCASFDLLSIKYFSLKRQKKPKHHQTTKQQLKHQKNQAQGSQFPQSQKIKEKVEYKIQELSFTH